MKYKVLLAGDNHALMDGFFNRAGRVFECMTVSERPGDMSTHLYYFEPEVFVYCTNVLQESKLPVLEELRRMTRRSKTPMAVVADREGLDALASGLSDGVELMLESTQTIGEVEEELLILLEGRTAPEGQEKAREETVQGEADSGKKHVLIVDDDLVMLRTIKGYLDEEYTVSVARFGKQALKFLETKHTDLILLDYMMPEMDGPQVLAALRSNERTEKIPVIFLTGITEMGMLGKVLSLKPSGYLLKPIDREKLGSMVKMILG